MEIGENGVIGMHAVGLVTKEPKNALENATIQSQGRVGINVLDKTRTLIHV